jgi:hypothetical protein
MQLSRPILSKDPNPDFGDVDPQRCVSHVEQGQTIDVEKQN